MRERWSDGEITIEPHEIEGVREYVELELESDCCWPSDRSEWRAAHKRIGWLLDLDDALAAADGESVTVEDDPFLIDLIRQAGKDGAERLGEALLGRYTDPERTAQEAKGLISLAQRLGVYEGVAI